MFGIKDELVHNIWWSRAPLSGLCYTGSDRIYVASSDGTVEQYPRIDAGMARKDQLSLAMPALFALDDQHVYAYGGAPGKGRVFFFDGKDWSELPPPPAWLIHMHGCAPDCIYAAAPGAVYLWNGKVWRQVLGAQQVFAGVWVATPDEVYAADAVACSSTDRPTASWNVRAGTAPWLGFGLRLALLGDDDRTVLLGQLDRLAAGDLRGFEVAHARDVQLFPGLNRCNEELCVPTRLVDRTGQRSRRIFVASRDVRCSRIRCRLRDADAQAIVAHTRPSAVRDTKENGCPEQHVREDLD